MSEFLSQGGRVKYKMKALMRLKSCKIMQPLDFIKLQAKNLLKDFRTRSYDEKTNSFNYSPKYFDIKDIFSYFEYPDCNKNFTFSLMNAQHFIAKMVGFEKWDDLIHAGEKELELAEFLLHKFKNSQDIQSWEESLAFSGVAQYGAEAKLAYARWHYELEEKQQLVNFPLEKLTILSGKQRKDVLEEFDDEHNPAGILRLDSIVYCTHCKKSFEFSKSKVIKDNESDRTMVVCKNYPNCKSSYLDFKVLTPTIIYGDAKIDELKKVSSHFSLDTKVHCIHCEEEYLFKDANVVLFPDDDEPLICCKNYPNCNGNLLDMIVNNSTDKN